VSFAQALEALTRVVLFSRLNNTWTPLVGGLLTAKIGTPRASILATGIIFLGQLLVLVSTGAGSSEEPGSQGNIKGMAAGLFIFGMGVSPLAVVQETMCVSRLRARLARASWRSILGTHA
jgi:hypothetical protein